MATKTRRGLAAGLTLALLLAVSAWPQLRLEIIDDDSRRPLLSLPVEPGVGFALSFHHSYDRAECVEHYRLPGADSLILEKLVTRSPLNGQGFVGGVYRPLPGGGVEVAGIDQAMDRLTFRLGSPDLANHQLIIRETRLVLNRIAAPGSLLTLQGRWRPWWWGDGPDLATLPQAPISKERPS